MRTLVERAFGQLKGRWRILLKKNDQFLESIPQCVIACVVLHNFCIKVNDLAEIDEADTEQNGENIEHNNDVFANVDVQEVICQYMLNNEHI